MNPIGGTLAFILFGLTVGMGIFFVVQGAGGLRRRRALGLSFVVEVGSRSVRDLVIILADSVLLAVGLALIYAGVATAFINIYR